MTQGRPVANAKDVLEACIYKSEDAGLFLSSLEASRIFKFNKLMLNLTF